MKIVNDACVKYKVSVIIPVYNMEDYLTECLDNVLLQTLGNDMEVICVDDGSTDGTALILEEYQKNNSNLFVLSQTNQGSGSARNNGMRNSHGKYIAFMDADDSYYSDDVLEYLYMCAERENVLICGGGLLFSQEGNVFVKESAGKQIFLSDGVISYRDYQYAYGFYRFIYNKEFLLNNNLFFPDYRRFQDPPFFVKTFIKAEKFYSVNKFVYVHRNTDKVIKFVQPNIANGVANGIDDIICMSRDAGLSILHSDTVISLIETWIEMFYKSIYDGNNLMVDILKRIWADMDEQLLKEGALLDKKPKLKTETEIVDYIQLVMKERDELINKIMSYSHVIIYGAGKGGRILGDYIMKTSYDNELFFAITSNAPSGTACGKEIFCINDLVKYAGNALVLIANKYEEKEIMKKNAIELGFSEVIYVDYNKLVIY